jgi:hypothetical protein
MRLRSQRAKPHDRAQHQRVRTKSYLFTYLTQLLGFLFHSELTSHILPSWSWLAECSSRSKLVKSKFKTSLGQGM